MNAPTGQAAVAGLADVWPADELARCFAKTEAGRLEISQRAIPLLRAARNLLLIIDPSRPAAGWLALVQGCDRAALQSLQDAGLVADTGAVAAGTPVAAGAPALSQAPAAPAPPAAAAPLARMTLGEALGLRSYSVLYDRITAEARPRLGLIRAYKVIMDVEHCSGPAEIRALAQRFVAQVRDVHGDAAAKSLTEVLTAPE